MVQFGCRSATAGMRSTSQRVLCSVYICVCPISRALRSFHCQPAHGHCVVLPTSGDDHHRLACVTSSPSLPPRAPVLLFHNSPDPHVRLGMSLLDFVPLEFLRVKSSAFEVCVNVDTICNVNFLLCLHGRHYAILLKGRDSTEADCT